MVVVDGGGVVVVVGGCVDGGGGAGTTVTVVLSFGPVMVTVCDVCGGAGSFGGVVLTGLDFVCPRLMPTRRLPAPPPRAGYAQDQRRAFVPRQSALFRRVAIVGRIVGFGCFTGVLAGGVAAGVGHRFIGTVGVL